MPKFEQMPQMSEEEQREREREAEELLKKSARSSAEGTGISGEIGEEKQFEIGSAVKVKRGNEEMEGEWKVASYIEEGDRVVVVREDPERDIFLRKTVSAKKLAEWNK